MSEDKHTFPKDLLQQHLDKLTKQPYILVAKPIQMIGGGIDHEIKMYISEEVKNFLDQVANVERQYGEMYYIINEQKYRLDLNLQLNVKGKD